MGARRAGAKITAPAYFIAGADDAVLRFIPLAKMDAVLTNLRGTLLLDGAGHWIQQERPDEASAALIEFARGVAGN